MKSPSTMKSPPVVGKPRQWKSYRQQAPTVWAFNWNKEAGNSLKALRANLFQIESSILTRAKQSIIRNMKAGHSLNAVESETVPIRLLNLKASYNRNNVVTERGKILFLNNLLRMDFDWVGLFAERTFYLRAYFRWSFVQGALNL